MGTPNFAEYLQLDSTSPSGLSWKKGPRRYKVPGTPAFLAQGTGGYYVGHLLDKRYSAHRIVFYLAYGYMPDQVDHIDGDRSNNHPDNLRGVSNAENQHNRIAKGYSYRKDKGKWEAQIYLNNTKKRLGYFSSKEEAHAAYLCAKARYHPTAPERCYAT